jgi:molybdate transport system substrate-binding protein
LETKYELAINGVELLRRGSNPFVLMSILVLLMLGCSSESNSNDELLIMSAASLAEAMGEIETSFESETGVDLYISLGGSQWLAQQIASGAPADLFISAGGQPIRFLVERGLTDGTPVPILTNQMVVVADSQRALRFNSLEDLKDPKTERIAIADPLLAPAGLYAKNTLMRLDVWNAIEDKLVFGADVRTTMAYVETGNADVAFVYATDAALADKLSIAFLVPTDSLEPIIYPAAIIAKPYQPINAYRFLDFLMGEVASSIFSRYGFEPVE